MNNKKLTLESLSVKSFITRLESDKLKGGTDTDNDTTTKITTEPDCPIKTIAGDIACERSVGLCSGHQGCQPSIDLTKTVGRTG